MYFSNYNYIGEKIEKLKLIIRKFVKYMKKSEYTKQFISYLLISRKLSNQLGEILIEFGIHMIIVRLIKMCLTEKCSRFHVGKNLSDTFPVKMV